VIVHRRTIGRIARLASFVAAWTTCACAIAACQPREGEPGGRAAGSRDTVGAALSPETVPADSARAGPALAALAAFLDASREGSATRDAVDTLAACEPSAATYLPIAMLATYPLRPAEARGDTIVGRAVVVTVAEQDRDRLARGRYVARQRVRADTLEWDVVADGASGRWLVCNGLRFGYHEPDSLTTWRTPGTSYRSARALADSIGRIGSS
jgi:hypothetical protein